MKLIIFLILSLALYGCSYLNLSKKVDNSDPFILKNFNFVNKDLGLVSLTEADAKRLIDSNQKFNAVFSGPRILELKNLGDVITLKQGELFYADFEIDTNRYTIETITNQTSKELTFTVIEKFSTRKVVLKNLCDVVEITSPDVIVQIQDDYNKSKNKPYKVIMVPTFDDNCIINGYLIRYDNEGRNKKIQDPCDSTEKVKVAEKKLDDCQGNGSSGNKLGPCGKRTNCPEWRMFRKCCP